MLDPAPMVKLAYGPQPDPQVDTMLVDMVLGAVTGGANDPLPVVVEPAAWSLIVSSGEPDTIGTTPTP